MEIAVAAPYPVSIWYTVDTYDDWVDAVDAAAAVGGDYQYEGYTVTGAGWIIDPDSRSEEPRFRGYLTFIGRAPTGSEPVEGLPESSSCHYGVYVGLGAVAGIITGAALIWALR